jgi:hypothetical protein
MERVTWNEARGLHAIIQEELTRIQCHSIKVVHTILRSADVIWTTVRGCRRFENAGIESVRRIEKPRFGAAHQRSVCDSSTLIYCRCLGNQEFIGKLTMPPLNTPRHGQEGTCHRPRRRIFSQKPGVCLCVVADSLNRRRRGG